jgi:hypothetical protein
MDTHAGHPDLDLGRFAGRVLFRTRSGTGVAVYEHPDGTWGFLWRPEDVGVTRTVRRTLSFLVRCPSCGVPVATCTTARGGRVSTPCLCADEREWRDAAERGCLVVDRPETDLDTFAARVLAEIARDEPFVLFGMVRGFVARYWQMIGRRPDARLWARFYRRAC